MRNAEKLKLIYRDTDGRVLLRIWAVVAVARVFLRNRNWSVEE